jgi:hypothetical protein
MLNHISIKILKSFTKDDIKKFTKFLNSPYHNESHKVIELFNELLNFIPDFNDDKLSKKNLWEKLYGDSIYKDSTITNLFFDLSILLKKYLTIENISKDKFRSNECLLNEYSERDFKSIFYKTIKDFYQEFIKKDTLGINHLLRIYEIGKLKLDFDISNKKFNKKQVAESVDDFLQGLYSFVTFFIAEIISSYLTISVIMDIHGIDYKNKSSLKLFELFNIKEILSVVKKESNLGFFISLYSAMQESTNDIENLDKYIEYKKILISNLNKLDKDEISTHYKKLANICMFNSNKGNKGLRANYFDNELFELYNGFLKNEKIDSRKNNMDYVMFRNIFLVALEMNQIEWAKDFINNYHDKVRSDYEFDLYNLGYAQLYYTIKDYNKSLEYINKVSLDNHMLKFDTRNLTLKLYYDLGYIDNLIYQIDNFRKFLKNSDDLKTRLGQKTTNFLNLFEKAVFIKLKKKVKYDKEYLIHLTSTTEPVLNKCWLLERINCL